MKLNKYKLILPLAIMTLSYGCEEVTNDSELNNCEKVPLFLSVDGEGKVLSDPEGVFLCGRTLGELEAKKALAAEKFTEESTKALSDFQLSKPDYLQNFELLADLDGLFGFGANLAIIDNPQSNDDNNSSKVIEVARGEGDFQGAGFNLPDPIDLTTENKMVTFKVFSEKALTVSLDFKAGLEGARSANAKSDHGGTGWETLSFDFSMATKAFEPDDPENFTPLPAEEVGMYGQIVFIVGETGDVAGTYYVDDLRKQ